MNYKFKTILFCAAISVTVGCSSLADLNTDALSSIANGNLPTEDASSSSISSTVSDVASIAKGFDVSDSEVQAFANSAIMQSDHENKIAPANNPYAIRLNKLVKRHFKEDGLNLKFKVYLTPDVNAFAVANGNIRVYSGLMDLLKDDELISVIGHEIGHVKLGHSKSQLKQAMITDGAMNLGGKYARSQIGSKDTDWLVSESK